MTRHVVQVCRQIQKGGGVSGVAYHLEKCFEAQDIPCTRLTAKTLKVALTAGSKEGLRGDVLKALEVVLFTLVATPAAWWARHRGKIVIVHNDALGGTIYVNHGLHRALMAEAGWRRILKNPLNVFIWARELVRFKLRLYDRVVCLSASEAVRLQQFYTVDSSLIRVIPNGVDLDVYRASSRPQRDRRALPLGHARVVATFIGHEFERKGLRSILNALVLPGSAHVSLQVVGGAPGDIRRFKAVAQRMSIIDRVTFLGVREDIPTLLQHTDLLVMMSDVEAFPLVGLEAMASGVPCLFSAGAAVGGYVDDGVNGYIVHSAEQMAEVFERASADPEFLHRLSRAAAATALSYDWAEVASMYLDLASSATAGRNY